mmetsp:Transcript_93209/g.170734  ORF Transcript_93209/g.170734 Transcript_93209/m.170734 type:complete len:135 (+) Transcript_93209:1084-1488(+)
MAALCCLVVSAFRTGYHMDHLLAALAEWRGLAETQMHHPQMSVRALPPLPVHCRTAGVGRRGPTAGGLEHLVAGLGAPLEEGSVNPLRAQEVANHLCQGQHPDCDHLGCVICRVHWAAPGWVLEMPVSFLIPSR